MCLAGKTYLGIQIVKLLVSNSLEQQGRQPNFHNGPILCVCFTNHALDQFLGGLIDHNLVQVVRVGGRSKSEKLDNYNLRHKTHRSASWSVRSLLKDAEATLKKLESAMDDIGKEMSHISS